MTWNKFHDQVIKKKDLKNMKQDAAFWQKHIWWYSFPLLNAVRLHVCLVLDLTQKFILIINSCIIQVCISETMKWYICWLPHVIAQDKDYDKKLRAGHNDIPLNYVANDDTHDSL